MLGLAIITASLASAVLYTFLLLLSFYRYLVCPLRHIPGPPWYRHPFTGDVGDYMQNMERRVQLTLQQLREYGGIYRGYYYFGVERIKLYRPDFARHVLKTAASKYSRGSGMGVEGLIFVAGKDNILMANGATHKRLRRVAAPGFTPPVLRECSGGINHNAKELTDKWLPEVGSKLVAVRDGLLVYAMRNLIHAIGLNQDEGVEEIIANSMKKLLATTKIQPLGIFPFHEKILTYMHRSAIRTTRMPWIMRKLSEQGAWTIEDLRSMISGIRTCVAAARENQSRPTKTLMASIINNCDKNTISEEEMTDLMITFLLAGTETTSTSLGWTLWLLAFDQGYQDRVAEECSAAEGDMNWDWVMADENLGLTKAAINESMRLYPPVPMISRRSLQPDTVCGYEFPAGLDMIIGILGIHRNPDVWGPTAQEFDPSREYPSDAFLPFSEGVHKCIGYQLAMFEMIVALASLVRSLRFERKEDDRTEARAVISLTPVPPIELVMTRRT